MSRLVNISEYIYIFFNLGLHLGLKKHISTKINPPTAFVENNYDPFLLSDTIGLLFTMNLHPKITVAMVTRDPEGCEFSSGLQSPARLYYKLCPVCHV